MKELTIVQACENLRSWAQTLNNHVRTFNDSALDPSAKIKTQILAEIGDDLTEVAGAVDGVRKALEANPQGPVGG